MIPTEVPKGKGNPLPFYSTSRMHSHFRTHLKAMQQRSTLAIHKAGRQPQDNPELRGVTQQAGYRFAQWNPPLTIFQHLNMSGNSLFWHSINAIIHFLSIAPNSASVTPSSSVLLMKQKGLGASLLLYITCFSLASAFSSPNVSLRLIVSSSTLFT